MNTELLTELFRNNDLIGSAQVASVDLSPMATNGIASEFLRATIRYSSDDHRLPDSMVIKRPLVGDRGQGEANVYELILGKGTELPVMTCYGVLDENPNEPLSLLFEDLSSSHHQTPWPVIPGHVECEAAVATLATIHGHWWGKADAIEAPTPPVLTHQNASHLASYFPDFVDYVGEYLSPARIEDYERIFANFDSLLASRLSASNTTLLHNDAHFWNFLYPTDPVQHDCVIFDWPLWRTGLAGWDLAYMIALHLYAEHRQRFEAALLDRYWGVLQEKSVSYDRADVQLDYRIGIVAGLLMPVMEFSWKIPPLDWMPKLEKAFAAYDDLNCRELLGAV